MSEHDDEDDSNFKCNFCDEVFEVLRELMIHKKDSHKEKVTNCWQFTSGSCPFGDQKCWFLHEIESNPLPYTCNLCEGKFVSQSQLLSHRKKDHGHKVPKCKNQNNGKCIYSNKTCWFNHYANETIDENQAKDKEIEENKEVIQKIFKMMEHFTDEIVKMKETNN